jgi:hypothetical protein
MTRPSAVLRSASFLLVVLALSACPARAFEAVVFISQAAPSDAWGRGLGASLTTTWFKVVALDAELARQGYDVAEGKLLSFSGAALFAPPFGRFTPYAGLGFGLYRETFGGTSDDGTLRSLVIGGKLKFGLLVIKAEYRSFDLSGPPLVEMNHRYYVGAGINL